MRYELLAAVNRYQELFAQVEAEEAHREDMVDLIRCGQHLIEMMARELVSIGRGERP